MTLYVVDTDIVIEYLKGTDRVVEQVDSLPSDTSISVTEITSYELYKGVYYTGNQEMQEEVESFLDDAGIIPLDRDAQRIAGEIYAELRESGKLINDADILIAATTCSAGGTLVTNNTSHFQRIDRLPIENWME